MMGARKNTYLLFRQDPTASSDQIHDVLDLSPLYDALSDNHTSVLLLNKVKYGVGFP